MDRIGPYTKEVFKHFKNPRNIGKMKSPDGAGKAGNIFCGDLMHLYLKVGKDKKGREVIKDAKFQTLGCLAAIATSSVITELVKGKTIEQALMIDRQEVTKSLAGLPPIKIHCSVLAVDALFEALYDYLSKNKKPIPAELQERHERIERAKKEIEKRYSQWIKLEEQIR